MDEGTRKTLFSSESDEWSTPPELLALVVDVMEGIGLDPCDSKDHPNPYARRNFNIDSDPDGLNRRWKGTIFMNPPFSNIGRWTEHLAAEYIDGACTEAVALLPARTDTKWFSGLAQHTKAFCFLKGRVLFIPPVDSGTLADFLTSAKEHAAVRRKEAEDAQENWLPDEELWRNAGWSEDEVRRLEDKLKKAKTKAPFPSVLLYLGWRPKKFMEVFESIGLVLQPPPRY